MSASAAFIVTLDGPAGVGKSTLARRVAEALGVAYLDTGAMFRVVAMHLATAVAGVPQGPELLRRLEECVFSLQGAGDASRLLCNGAPLGDSIRSEEAGMMAAKAALVPEVREYLKAVQQRLGREFSLVAEGRDMGTVVFPDAACKIFLDADPAVRAERRYRQLQDMGKPCDLAELTEQIRRRDAQDRGRAIAPLRPAADAHSIDTSAKDIEAVFSAIMAVVTAKQRASSLPPPVRQ